MAKLVYHDRSDAGRKLAKLLFQYANRQDVLVLALPRGGVPVAYEVARALHAPLDVFVVRKLGVPGHEELAMGAIAIGGTRVINMDVVQHLHIPDSIIETVAAREQQELERRTRMYRDNRPLPTVHNRTVILIDDGLATGATMLAAIQAIRQENPARLVVAVPVAAPSTCHEIGTQVDEIICAYTPDPLFGVGWWYDDFSQTSDQEVHDLLARAEQERPLFAHKHA